MRTSVGYNVLMLLHIAQALGPVDQEYLLEARQMQALSFAVHIPLVCFGVAFPAMVLFMEWLGLPHRRPALLALATPLVEGDDRAVRRRRRDRDDPVVRAGAAVARVHGHFGDVFGLAFAFEGLSFFVEAIFIAIYVYGWDRLSPRAHMLAGIPVVIAGFTRFADGDLA